MRSAESELQNTIELRATASKIVAPQPDLDARAEKKTILKHFLKGFLEGKSLAPKWRKSANKSMSQPSCSHSSTIYEIQLQSHLQWGNDPRVANQNRIPSATHPPAPLATPFTLRERSYSCKSQWNCRPHMHEKQLKPHLQCGTDPTMIREYPTTHETVSQPSHRRGRSSRFGDELCLEKHRVWCICYLSKTHFVRDFLQNSIGNSSTTSTCNPIYNLHCGNDPRVANHNEIPSATAPPAPLAIPFTLRERSYSCKSQWNSVDHTLHEKQLKPHLQCGTDPTMIRPWSENIRPHTRPSRNRRTAEVDHRGSGTNFVWKNIGFGASAISQKRISCETSFKTASATPPPAPLAIPFTVRERS